MKIFSRTPLKYIIPPLYFRYLLSRLVQPFFIVLGALSVIWLMVDLYGNLETFLDRKAPIGKMVLFTALEVPDMLPVTMPATMLFASLFALLNLNRRSELVAMESGGYSPIRLYLPFFFFAFLMSFVLAVDLFGPAPWADLKREEILLQVRGTGSGAGTQKNLIYLDRANNRTWRFDFLDFAKGYGTNMDILCRNSDHVDIKQYFVKTAKWNPTRCIWELKDVKVVNYGPTSAVSSEENRDEVDFDSTTPPSQMVLVNTTPDQLTFHELGEYIETVQTAAKMAQYRTEWWYRIFYPSSLIVLLLFSLAFGTQTGRKSALTPVVWCIVVFLAYFASVQLFRATGQSNRINPIVAASAVEAFFAVVGVLLLAHRIGWFREIRGFFIRNGLLRAPEIEA